MFSENHPYEGQEITAFNSNALFHKKKQYSIRIHGNSIGKFCTFFLSIFFWFYFTRKVKIDRKIKREESNDENTTGKQEGYSSFIDDRPTRNITTFQKARLSGNPFYAPLPRYNQGMAMDSKRYVKEAFRSLTIISLLITLIRLHEVVIYIYLVVVPQVRMKFQEKQQF